MDNGPNGHQVTDIDVRRNEGVAVTYDDGYVASFDLEELRVNCPCAECRGLRERGGTVWPRTPSPQPLHIEHAELVGNWGITFDWNDGHGTGIFTWDVLRNWSEQRHA